VTKGNEMNTVFKCVAIAALTLLANVAPATAANTGDGTPDAAGGPDASALMQFYPTPLATSPVGAIEDKAVWLAKVQGLIDDAPPLLQQSMLASKTQKQFAANLALLEQMQLGTLQKGVTAAKSVAKSGKVAAKGTDGKVGPNLGSGPADTVFTYLEPCRIMDTRNALVASGVRGPLVGNQLYQLPGFIPAGGAQNWGDFGGNATSDCGLNSTVGANIWALAIVITILNPNFDAYLGVGDKNTLAATLSTVALNYTHGQGLSTQYIVPQGVINTIYFAMPAQLSANIIFDVVGYFAVSQATALDCVTAHTSGVGTANFPGNTDFSLNFPNCSAGYSRTGTGCEALVLGANVWLSADSTYGSNNCTWHNTGAGGTLDQSSFTASRTCCRIPGRP